MRPVRQRRRRVGGEKHLLHPLPHCPPAHKLKLDTTSATGSPKLGITVATFLPAGCLSFNPDKSFAHDILPSRRMLNARPQAGPSFSLDFFLSRIVPVVDSLHVVGILFRSSHVANLLVLFRFSQL